MWEMPQLVYFCELTPHDCGGSNWLRTRTGFRLISLK
jgi:hypothetical protein